jgi:hypothetical protein
VSDALVPMAPLLEAVPLVVVRGNHERCAPSAAGSASVVDSPPPPPGHR